MKYKIICDFCGKEHVFSNRFEAPKECSNKACRNSLEGLEIIVSEAKKSHVKSVIGETDSPKKTDTKTNEKLEITGLELIYQTNGRKIIIDSLQKTILGRNNTGSELLAGIPQISRAHCSIEFDGDTFKVIDLGSTNGTFIGLGKDKTECNEAQELCEDEFLILGEEAFLVKYKRKILKKEQVPKVEKEKKILCTECSCILQELPTICPDCGAWNE